jgi:hypothetical protein
MALTAATLFSGIDRADTGVGMAWWSHGGSVAWRA